MDPTPTVIPGAREGDPLQTKYYCQVDRSEKMDVVMELKPTKRINIQRLPLRYVLVIDVSGSMNDEIGVQHRTLLQRVKLFSELAVRKVGENDWLSIVSFSNNCVVEMGMTRMSKSNKGMARNILKSLQTRGNTNLECGLIGALQVINSAPKLFRASRDCIILFTDGVANDGLMDAKKLIEKYRKTQANMNRSSCVPVSAFTIGGYRPDLLIEISRHLGSESFYWLNDEEDFEADLLIPLFLREVTGISDVDIRIQANANCYFQSIDENAPHLQGIETSKVKIFAKKKKKKMKMPTRQLYFIHSMPDDHSKNISFSIALSGIPSEKLDGLKAIDVTVHYLDDELLPRSIQDSIELNVTPLTVSRPGDLVELQDAEVLKAWTECAAFTVTANHSNTSWRASQEVIVKVAEERCKSVSAMSIANAKNHAGGNSLAEGRKCFQAAFQEISRIKSRTQGLLPNGGDNFQRLGNLMDEWSTMINHANDIMATNDSRNFSKLTSMETSISVESPTCGGIFRGSQPFMNDVLAEKLVEEKKNLEAIRRLYSGGEIDIGTAKHRAQRAIEAGNIDTMESCFQDLKAMELFGGEVEENFVDYVKQEIDHRKSLNELKGKLSSSLAKEDYQQVESLITEMRDLKAKNGLTFTDQDEAALQAGVGALKLHKKKRSLRGDISSFMPNLNLPIVPANLKAISIAIQSLVRLRNEAKIFDDVFTHRDNASLNMAIANLHEAKKEMDQISQRMSGIRPVLGYPRRPSNYEAIKEAVRSMQEAKNAAGKYEGLFAKEDEVLLKTACDNMDLLTGEKTKLKERIQQVQPTLELPTIPRNFVVLSEAVEEMTSLFRKAKGFKDVFLPEHETLLNQGSSNVALLMVKRDELVEKIAANVFDVRLPKLPANLEKLATAVAAMTEAREESKGFENVFTAEHSKLLQSAEASAEILRCEKVELEKETAECVAQIQLQMLPANYNQICQGIDTMKRVASELRGFGIYEGDYDSMLKKAEFNADVLSRKKDQIMNDIQKLKPELKVALAPENLVDLRGAVEKMKSLKAASRGFENVFTSSLESDLFEATANLDHLTAKVDQMNEARQKLEHAVEKESFIRLKHAIKMAVRAPFIHPDELKEPRKLMLFLDPKKRRAAVKEAIEQGDIEAIEDALLDLREAHVTDDKIENQARHALKVLRKQKKREEKERRRIEREKARRKREKERQEENLSSAIGSRDIESLEQALQEFEDSEFEKDEVTLATEADELLQHLKIERMRQRLQDGLRRRDVEMLYSALMEAKFGNYEEHMRKEYEEAEGILVYLLEMMRLREEITKMTRASITEVHGYRKPPRSVKKVMQAIYTILGEPPSELKDWAKIQGLMGRLDRNSIAKRVQCFRIRSLQPETAVKAERLLDNLCLPEVEDVSKVAATFYAWAKYVVKEVEHLREQAERKDREIEEAEKDGSEKYDEEEFESEQEESTKEEPKEEEENSDSTIAKSLKHNGEREPLAGKELVQAEEH